MCVCVCVYVCVCVCVCVYVCVCVGVCVCVCVFVCVWVFVCVGVGVCLCLCVTIIFRLFILYEPPSSLLQINIQVLCYAVTSPLIFTNASSAPDIRRHLRLFPACHRPQLSIVVPTGRQPPGSLASGILRPSMDPAMPSLPHFPDPVSGKCMPPCTWGLRGEWNLISLSLMTSEP